MGPADIGPIGLSLSFCLLGKTATLSAEYNEPLSFILERAVRAGAVLAGDLGGTNFRGAIVDRSLRIRDLRSVRVPYPATPRAVLGMVNGVLQGLLRSGGPRPSAVCLSLKGLVDPERGLLKTVSDFTAWKDVPIAARVGALGLPVCIENDAKCAALGEGRAGRARGADDFVFVIVGTGIGTGIVSGGTLRRGARGHAGELGHWVVDASAREFRCACGQTGDLESLAAGPSLGLRAKRLIARGDRGLKAFLRRRGGPVDGRFVAAALEAGVPAAARIVEEAGTWLGVGLYNMARAFDPSLIVIGGGVSNLGEALLAPARRECGRRLAAFRLPPPRILRSSLGDRAGLLGAATLVLRP